MYTVEMRQLLVQRGMRVTPQRLAVLEAFAVLKKHPTAEQVTRFVRDKNPHIATGTVYKILETFTDRGILAKVKTDKDHMRYDAIHEKHHHLYCLESDRIEDYFDDELNELLHNYFADNNIPGFEIQDINLQIIGKFEHPGG
ncbi:MAG: transcriptional repressor [Bacteroidales bacterium]|nr:transcriptional repressor [Bacteroidales bacterium]